MKLSIHFTNETSSFDQSTQCVSFLDTEVCKLDNGEELTKGERNSTHTDKYLTYDFHNPRQDKKAVVKGKWQQTFLSSRLKETPKQHMEVYYRIFISALFREKFSFEIFSSPPSWIFVDMHDTSQLGHAIFFITTQ